MTDQIKASVVRIQSAGGRGAGFVVLSSGLIVTCAHVLGYPPQNTLLVTFYPTEPEHPQQRKAILIPELYDPHLDVAFLRVEEVPEGIRALPLGASARVLHHPVHTFGFPNVAGVHGLAGNGQIAGETSNDRQRLLQIGSCDLTQGFSGAPVWDERRLRVIGMVSSTIEQGKLAHVACAIPTETLKAIYKELSVQDFCPYLGLMPYTEQDAHLFFGREQYIQDLLDLLARDRRLLAIFGPIGSGKTSVIQAGLLPHLRQNPSLLREIAIDVVMFQPSRTPLVDLLAQEYFAGVQTYTLLSAFGTRRNHAPERGRPVLFLDQFELFLTLPEREERQAFFSQLVELIQSDLCTVLIAMRNDSYNSLAEYSELIRLIERQLSNIPSLTYEGIRSAIEKPAAFVDLGIQDGLAHAIANDTTQSMVEPPEARRKRHSSALPLLSFLMKHLWEKRDDECLTFQAFEDLGGIAGSLTTFATQVYASLEKQQQSLARRIFTDLVTLGEDRDGRFDSRRPRTLSQLCRHDNERETVHAVVTAFAEAHLLEMHIDDVSKELTVRIIHDALLYDWQLLRDWLRDDHDFIVWHQELAHRTRHWVQSADPFSHARDESLFLAGKALALAEYWWRERPEDISQEEQCFIQTGIQRKEAEEKRQKAYEEMLQQQRVALARQLALQSLLLQEQHPEQLELSVLLAVEAMRRYPCVEADQALRQGLALLPSSLVHVHRDGMFSTVLFSHDGFDLAAAGAEGVLWMHNIHGTSRPKRWSVPGRTHALALSPAGDFLLAAGQDGLAWLLDPVNGHVIALQHTAKVRAVTYRPGVLPQAVTASEDGTVCFWSIPDGHLVHTFSHRGSVYAAAVSHDGHYLATASADQTAGIWEITSQRQLRSFLHEGLVTLVAFSPDDQYLAAACGNAVAVWSWRQERRRAWKHSEPVPLCVFRHHALLTALSFSPDGSLLATAGEDAAARVWNLQEQREVQHYTHSAPITALHFHPQGHLLATTSQDHTTRIWHLSQQDPLHVLPLRSSVHDVCFHPHKPYIATASDTDGVWLCSYEYKDMQQMVLPGETVLEWAFYRPAHTSFLRILTEVQQRLTLWEINIDHPSPLALHETVRTPGIALMADGKMIATYPTTLLKFSADGTYLATADPDGTVKVWKTEPLKLAAYVKAGDAVSALAFSPDAQRLAIARQHGPVHLWHWQDVSSLSSPVYRGSGPVQAITFSHDGSRLIALTADHMVHVWQWHTAESKHLFTLHHSDPIRRLALSWTDQHLLTVSIEGSASVWNMATGSLAGYLSHDNAILAATFSADGSYIATAGSDGVTGIWETTTGRQLASLEHQTEVYAAAFSPEGRYVVTASRDSSLYLWRWHPEDLIREANTHVTRNLTHEEWQTYIGDEPYRRTCEPGWRERAW